jgi:hypothetical protein
MDRSDNRPDTSLYSVESVAGAETTFKVGESRSEKAKSLWNDGQFGPHYDRR